MGLQSDEQMIVILTIFMCVKQMSECQNRRREKTVESQVSCSKEYRSKISYLAAEREQAHFV